MKAIMITFNQAHSERIEFMMDKLDIKGYTLWENVQGRGTNTGVPHLATHAWPEINKSLLMIVDEEKVDPVLDVVKKIDSINEEVGIRAFVWDVLKTV
jgi:nitrogen regulatory protein PII